LPHQPGPLADIGARVDNDRRIRTADEPEGCFDLGHHADIDTDATERA
jgi:hypothetical protein